MAENFVYDALNRLTGAAIVDGPGAKSYQYDLTGNIVFKSDVGTYSYPAPGSARPHAVTSVAAGAVANGVNASFAYDAVGNLLSGNGRTLSWTAFNMPAQIARGAATLSFAYDSEYMRIQQVAPDGTTLYLNDPVSGIGAEKYVGTGGAVRWPPRHFRLTAADQGSGGCAVALILFA